MNFADFFSAHLDRIEEPVPFDRKLIPTHGGVYALVDAEDRLIFLSSTQDLRRAIGHRLCAPPDEINPLRADVRPITQRIWWQPAYSQFETYLTFHALARRLEPSQYRRLCAFGPAWFAVIDMNDQFPRWRASNNPITGVSACVGPWTARSKCEQFVKDLEDLFSLCRYHDILQQTPHGEPCAYFEMGRCPAPCDGTISFEQYRGMLAESILMTQGGCAALKKRLTTQMQQASERLQFETASRLKHDINQAGKLDKLLPKMVRRFEDFRYLIVQRARGRTKVCAFLVNCGEIACLGPVALKELDDVVPQWLAKFRSSGEPTVADQTLAMERIWLVSHFLHKSNRTPGLYLRESELGDAEIVAERVRRTFVFKRKVGLPRGEYPK